MEHRNIKNKSIIKKTVYYISALSLYLLFSAGCGTFSGYSNESVYPDNVHTVSLKMFDNQTFRRGVEYDLSDALAKRIEADTPYKIVTSQDYADTVISGQITAISEFALTIERQTGHVLEKEVEIRAVVNWKNLKTGELLIDNLTISSYGTYSEFQQQDFKYGSTLAANNLAQNIVEVMEKKW